MVRNFIAILGLVIYAVFPSLSPAQEATTVLAAVAKTINAENVNGFQYSGSGSSEVVDPSNPDKPMFMRVKSFKAATDLNARMAAIEAVRVKDSKDQTDTRSISPSSAWDQQYEYWINPYAFLKGALAHEATVKSDTLQGEKYKVVTFSLDARHKLNGYINDRNFIERVETWLDNNERIEGIFRSIKTSAAFSSQPRLFENVAWRTSSS